MKTFMMWPKRSLAEVCFTIFGFQFKIGELNI